MNRYFLLQTFFSIFFVQAIWKYVLTKIIIFICKGICTTFVVHTTHLHIVHLKLIIFNGRLSLLKTFFFIKSYFFFGEGKYCACLSAFVSIALRPYGLIIIIVKIYDFYLYFLYVWVCIVFYKNIYIYENIYIKFDFRKVIQKNINFLLSWWTWIMNFIFLIEYLLDRKYRGRPSFVECV